MPFAIGKVPHSADNLRAKSLRCESLTTLLSEHSGFRTKQTPNVKAAAAWTTALYFSSVSYLLAR